MSRRAFLQFLEAETKNLRQAGLIRPEIELKAPPSAIMRIGDRDFVSYLSSDYLGLANHPEVKRAANAATEAWGVGVAGARALAGTIALHGELERAIVKLTGAEDALVFPSGHHAAAGLFEALLGDRDYIFADEMVRPSVADGIRLSRARAYSYRNSDTEHLADRLKRSRAARFRVIATDGAFPVTGRVADLQKIYELAQKYHAIVVVDDTHGLGVLGPRGGGSHALAGIREGIDVVMSSFGAALGGGAGGFVAGRSAIVSWLRQKSRTHLTSTALAPGPAAAALKAIEIVQSDPSLHVVLGERLQVLRDAMTKDAGVIPDTVHPAVSVLLRNAVLAQKLTDRLYRQGIFALGYCHPIVPEGDARLSLRVTIGHANKDLEATAKAVGEGMRELKIQL